MVRISAMIAVSLLLAPLASLVPDVSAQFPPPGSTAGAEETRVVLRGPRGPGSDCYGWEYSLGRGDCQKVIEGGPQGVRGYEYTWGEPYGGADALTRLAFAARGGSHRGGINGYTSILAPYLRGSGGELEERTTTWLIITGPPRDTPGVPATIEFNYEARYMHTCLHLEATVCTSGSSVRVELESQTYSYYVSTHHSGDGLALTQGQLFYGGGQHRLQGVDAGFEGGILYVNGEHATTGPVTLPLNQPFPLTMHMTLAAGVGGFSPAAGGYDYEAGRSFTLATDRPALSLPPGYTARTVNHDAMRGGRWVDPEGIFATAVGTSLAGALPSTDYDNETPLSYAIESAPAHGTLVLAADGTFSYVPEPGFEGRDTFVYRATPQGDAADAYSRRAAIDVGPVNDAPTVIASMPPVVQLGAPIALRALASDPDFDALSYSWSYADGTPAGQGAAVDLPTSPQRLSTQCLRADVTDAVGHQASATGCTYVNAPPAIELAALPAVVRPEHPLRLDASPSHDPNPDETAPSLEWVHEGVTTPGPVLDLVAPSTMGPICPRATARDAHEGVSTLEACVLVWDFTPTVRDDHASVSRYGQVVVDAVANDDDAEDGRPAFHALVQPPRAGDLTVSSAGVFTYTPDPARFADVDRFTYEACDSFGQCDVATVFVHELTCARGIEALRGTMGEGFASDAIYDEVTPRLHSVNAGLARQVDEANCALVVPAEAAANAALAGVGA